jgi:hypothetical protein
MRRYSVLHLVLQLTPSSVSPVSLLLSTVLVVLRAISLWQYAGLLGFFLVCCPLPTPHPHLTFQPAFPPSLLTSVIFAVMNSPF